MGLLAMSQILSYHTDISLSKLIISLSEKYPNREISIVGSVERTFLHRNKVIVEESNITIVSCISFLYGKDSTIPHYLYSQIVNENSGEIRHCVDTINSSIYKLFANVEEQYDISYLSTFNKVSDILSSLLGIELQNNSFGFVNNKIMQYSCMYRSCISLKDLELYIEDFFDIKVKVETGNCIFHKLDDTAHTRIGSYGLNNDLGVSSLLGKKALLPSDTLIIRILPKSRIQQELINTNEKIIVNNIRNFVSQLKHSTKNIKIKIKIKIVNKFICQAGISSKKINRQGILGKNSWILTKKE